MDKVFDVGQTDLLHLGRHVEASRRNNLELVHGHQKLSFGEVLVQIVACHVISLALEAHFSRKFQEPLVEHRAHVLLVVGLAQEVVVEPVVVEVFPLERLASLHLKLFALEHGFQFAQRHIELLFRLKRGFWTSQVQVDQLCR